MIDERDPLLESLFAQARRDFDDEAFVADCMAGIRRRRRTMLASRIAIAALIVILELALDAPLKNSIGAIAAGLATELYAIDNEWLAFILSPVNSVAGLVGLLLLGLHFLHRRIM